MTIEGKWLRLEFRYDRQTIEKVKALARMYGVSKAYDPKGKTWRLPASAAGHVAKELPSLGRCKETEKAYRSILEARTARRVMGSIMCDANDVDIGDRTLFSHQREAVDLICDRSLILAHDMGLGKTLSSLVAAKLWLDYSDVEKVIVVSPPNSIYQWDEEVSNLRMTDQTEICSWGKVTGLPGCPFMLIVDEAHYMQNISTKRTQDVLMLAIHPDCRNSVLLTGTPMKNGRPSNLYPLLVAVRHPLALDRRGYELRYCDAKATHFTKWDTTGKSNVSELKQRVGNVINRKRKSECIDLPEKLRVIHRVEPQGPMKDQYYTVFGEGFSTFCASVNKRFKQAKLIKDERERELALESARGFASARGVVSLTNVRKAASHAKVEATVELAKEVIEEGNQVVIFTMFREPATKIAKALGLTPLIGGSTPKQIKDLIVRFKSGEDRALVATFGSGGVGLDLPEGNTVILHDRSFVPGDVEQAEDRCYRIGTHWPVTCIWVQAFKVDEAVDRLLIEKQETITDVIEGGETIEVWRVIEQMMDESEAVEDLKAEGQLALF